MFVQGKTPRPVGTLLRFELMLADGEPIKGVGEVVWIRPRSQGPEAPSGMGIQFGHVDDSDREILKAVVFQALEEAGATGSPDRADTPTIDETPPPRRPVPPADTAKPRKKSVAPKPRARAKLQLGRKAGDQASRPLKKKAKKTQGSAPAVSGTAKVLLIILALLALLLLLT